MNASFTTLGIDLGIGSCGWAYIRETEDKGEIVGLGVRTFDVPETAKERTPTNQLRRQFRGLRRVLRRRRQRMNALRVLLAQHGLLSDDARDALYSASHSPWQLRAAGLDRRLSPLEFALVLGHIAKHRGFRSNSKRDRGANAPKDSSDMLKVIEATRQRLADYRTVGEMFARDPDYAGRKRNRDGDYSRSILRQDQEREITLLFEWQQQLGNQLASHELEAAYAEIAFSQRPLADSEHMVGACGFEPNEKRAARFSYSFELFRFLARLTQIRIAEQPLSAEDIRIAIKDFGAKTGLSFKQLRKQLGLPDGARFDGVAPENEGQDVISRHGKPFMGTATLRSVLGPAWASMLAMPEKLDAIAFILTFREDINSIRTGLEQLGLEAVILDALMVGVEDGSFARFKGAGHISAKACRAIIPFMAQGLVYSDACAKAGYDHAARPVEDLDSIANPVARKALREAVKQIKAVVTEYGVPDFFHIELARDVGKSQEEREEIRFGIEKRNKEKDRLREKFKDDVGREPNSGEDLLRYELWKEQNGRCLYSDEYIDPNWIVASDNRVQVDHILPWSRSGDDSFINKTLCLAKANQEKKGQTPYEWFGKNEARWEKFTQGVESIKAMKGRKKRNYLLKDATLLEEKFRPRNLGDTRYATRLLLNLLKTIYPDSTVRARPGALTDRLRRGWGMQGKKKDADGKRIEDDRHHALDALIVATIGEAALQRLTKAFQEAERKGDHRSFTNLVPPWEGFRQEAEGKLRETFVSRAERRRARGAGHEATIRQIIATDDGDRVSERKSVEKLTEADLGRVKDAERNTALIDSLRAWIAAGKPKGSAPLSPKGDPIRKVRLISNGKPAVQVRGGAADRGEIVRVDVFRKANRKGKFEFYLVPIYPHQVADEKTWPKPPNQAIVAYKDEVDWPEMTPDYEFMWSLNPFCFVELEKADGTFIDGYFRGVDRTTGAIGLSPHETRSTSSRGIGVKSLTRLSKWQIDRLGRRFEIKQEIRTWHGVACT